MSPIFPPLFWPCTNVIIRDDRSSFRPTSTRNHLRQPSYPRYLRILRYRYYEGWKVRVKPSDVSKIKLQWQVSDWSVCKFQSFFWFYLTLCNFVSSLFSCNCFSFFCFFFLNGISWLLRKFLQINRFCNREVSIIWE